MSSYCQDCGCKMNKTHVLKTSGDTHSYFKCTEAGDCYHARYPVLSIKDEAKQYTKEECEVMINHFKEEHNILFEMEEIN